MVRCMIRRRAPTCAFSCVAAKGLAVNKLKYRMLERGLAALRHDISPSRLHTRRCGSAHARAMTIRFTLSRLGPTADPAIPPSPRESKGCEENPSKC